VRVGPGCRSWDIVHRVDNAPPEEVTPHPVHRRFREERVVSRGQPFRVSPATLGIGWRRALAGPGSRKDELGVHHAAVLRVLHVEILPLVVEDLFAHFVTRPETDCREEGRHFVVLVLRPALERMVVALGAHHPYP
jgi:hypothetical protein